MGKVYIKSKTNIKMFVGKMLNIITPKHKNRIYARPLESCHKVKCDIINNSFSNLNSVLKELRINSNLTNLEICLEVKDETRLPVLQSFVDENFLNGICFHFIILNHFDKNPIKRLLYRVKNLYFIFSSRIWLCETGDSYPPIQTKKQKVICFNYFISCKNDLIAGDNFRWTYLDGIVSTSLLVSQIMSSSIGVKLDKCYNLGFPRNDVFFEKDKKDLVLNWIQQKVGFVPKYIVLYAPTVRDHESDDFNGLFLKDGDSKENYKRVNRPMLGYESSGLNNLLVSNDAVFIHNLHPLQKVDIISEDNCMIAYENNYDFTFYDVMAVSDCMITDYSSIGYDFLLADKPLIYNLYDFSMYESCRGLSYEPYEDFCPGEIVTNWQEMQVALENVFSGNDVCKEKRRAVTRLLHKYTDGNSTQRVVQFLEKVINGK